MGSVTRCSIPTILPVARTPLENRVAMAKQHWGDGGYMNPSICSMNSHGSFDWGDGRHRMVAASQMGEVYSPVLIDTADLDGFSKTGIRTTEVS